MKKMRAQTIQQRMGFRDEALSTPEHDKLMLWLDENAQMVIERIHGAIESKVDLAWINEELERRSSTPISESELPDLDVRVISKTWEVPVMSGRYVVGFIDMQIEFETNELITDRRTKKGWNVRKTNKKMNFEVKPSILSLGELIRQIRLYQKYEENQFCIISPDDRFMKNLVRQGIMFYPCPKSASSVSIYDLAMR